MKKIEKRGRPKINPEDYNPNWEEEVASAYSEGKSDTWIRAKCFKKHVVSDDLWYRWIEEIEIFSRAIKNGKKMSQAWWEDVSQEHASGCNTDANATSLIFNMSNRFKEQWKQRQSVEQTTKHSLDIDELDKLQEFLEENGVDTKNL